MQSQISEFNELNLGSRYVCSSFCRHRLCMFTENLNKLHTSNLLFVLEVALIDYRYCDEWPVSSPVESTLGTLDTHVYQQELERSTMKCVWGWTVHHCYTDWSNLLSEDEHPPICLFIYLCLQAELCCALTTHITNCMSGKPNLWNVPPAEVLNYDRIAFFLISIEECSLWV